MLIEPVHLSAAALVLGVGLGVVAVRQWYDRRQAERQNDTLSQQIDLLTDILENTADGWYAWIGTSGVGESGVGESGGGLFAGSDSGGTATPLSGGRASRRLSLLLDCYLGRDGSFRDVFQSLTSDSAQTLEAAALALRQEGQIFDVVVDRPQDLGFPPRRLRVQGLRYQNHTSRPEGPSRTPEGDSPATADVIWFSDLDSPQESHPPTGPEGHATGDLWQDALGTLPHPIWIRDADLRLIYVNRAFVEALEAPSPQQILHEERELADGLAARELRALASAARASGVARQAPFHVVLHGERRLIEVIETPVHLGDDILTVGLAQDMTRLESLRSTLEREATGHAMVLERLGTAVAIYGPDTRLRFYNTAFARLWGLDSGWLDEEPPYAEVLEAQRSRRLLPEVADWPAFRTQELDRFTSLLDTREDLLHLPDGTTLRRLLAPHTLGGLMATYEDVSDRLALETARNTVVAVQKEILEHLHEGVAVFGGDGRLRLGNPAFARLWGLDARLLADTPTLADLTAALPPPLAESQAWQDLRSRLGSAPQDRQVCRTRHQRGDGAVLETTVVPLPDGGNLFTFLDISDKTLAESALQQRADALVAADRMKMVFMANASQELRTPLTTILGFAEILADEYYGPLNVRQRDYARTIVETAQHVSSLLDQIGDLVLLEAGRLTLKLDTCDIHATLAAVLGLVREAAKRRSHTLNFDCPPDIGSITADCLRLRQCLVHLMLTAIANTPDHGQITLACLPQDATSEHPVPGVVFVVADTGHGLAEDQQSTLFDRPFVARSAMTLSGPAPGPGPEESLGLGLALVRRLVALHGGTISVESVPGQGTTILLFLPDKGR